MYINIYKGVIDENIIIDGVYERIVCDMESFLSDEDGSVCLEMEEELRILLRWKKEIDELERVNIMNLKELELIRVIVEIE